MQIIAFQIKTTLKGIIFDTSAEKFHFSAEKQLY